MKYGVVRFFGLSLISLIISSSLNGNDDEKGESTVVLTQVGWIDIQETDADILIGGAELRLHQDWHGIRPWIGGYLVDDGGTWFAGGGLFYNFKFPMEVDVSIGSGPFYYNHHGHSRDMGFELEFYSFLEISRNFKDLARIGIRLGHISNARLSDENPGTETLGIVAAFPL